MQHGYHLPMQGTKKATLDFERLLLRSCFDSAYHNRKLMVTYLILEGKPLGPAKGGLPHPHVRFVASCR